MPTIFNQLGSIVINGDLNSYDGVHPNGAGFAMADGSVRFVSDSISPSGEDSLGLFQINLATDQPTESKTFGQPVTFTATIHNPSGFAAGVFVASGDVDGSHHGSSGLEGATEGLVDTRWVPIVGDWNGDGRDAVGGDNSYAGSHLLYQDFVVPVSNLDPYVFTSVDHMVGDPSAPMMDSANNLEQIAIAIHALDAGECSVDICAKNSPSASPEPVTHTGWGPWEVVLGGPILSPANTGYGNPPSVQINSLGADDMGRSFDLIFPTQTAFPKREGNAVATESLEIAHEGFLDGRDDGWCMAVEIDSPESVHALYDLVV
jgi:prepilin-type processing-associated H-X9-DG protein